jgi:UDP-glucose 4-epimerase
MKILVTGGGGFIGSHLVDKLLARGNEVFVFDRSIPPKPQFGVKDWGHKNWWYGDLLTAESVLQCVEEHNPDVIYHLAAIADVNEVFTKPVEATRVNVLCTQHILEAARAVKAHVIYASTIWVYSDAIESSVDESSPIPFPSHPYTVGKYAGEMLCHAYLKTYNVPYTILRFGIPYGPRARSAAVIPSFVAKAFSGQNISITGDGSQWREFVYVEDLADGCVAALRSEAVNEVFNLSGSERTTIRDLALMVQHLAPSPIQVFFTESRAADFRGVKVSNFKAERLLEWKPHTPFVEGLQKYIDWYYETL